MSLGITIKGPEGIVLAAESRITLTATIDDGSKQVLPVNYDNATKLLSFENYKNIGAITYGLAAIRVDNNPRTPASYLAEFEEILSRKDGLSTYEVALLLSDFFMSQFKRVTGEVNEEMYFVVAGYDHPEPYGRVYQFSLPTNPEPTEKYAHEGEFGMSWGGQTELVVRLIKGYDPRIGNNLVRNFGIDEKELQTAGEKLKDLELPFPWAFMPLQDCVDLATSLINTTITLQRLSIMQQGCGGPIDVATITRKDGIKFIKKKSIRVES